MRGAEFLGAKELRAAANGRSNGAFLFNFRSLTHVGRVILNVAYHQFRFRSKKPIADGSCENHCAVFADPCCMDRSPQILSALDIP